MSSSPDIALPPYAHLPGMNQRHPEDFMDEAKTLASEQTTDANAATNPAWLHGLRLIDLAFYWEAHEILETVWMRAAPNSRERHLVQGIIHLANALLKSKMDRHKAAERLLTLARNHIDEAFVGSGGSQHAAKTLMLLQKDQLARALILSSQRPKLSPN